jgi:hypothetical protein
MLSQDLLKLMDIAVARAKAHSTKLEQDFTKALNRATLLKDNEQMEALTFLRSVHNRTLEITSLVMKDSEDPQKLLLLVLVNGDSPCTEERKQEFITQLLGRPMPPSITAPFYLNYKWLNLSGFKVQVPKDLYAAVFLSCAQSPELSLQVTLKAYFNFMPVASEPKVYNGFYLELKDIRVPVIQPIL